MRPLMKGEPALTLDEPVHVDDFIDDHKQDAYARWMFMHFRLPADQQHDFKPFIQMYKLFCTYEGRRYRVTGASRLGDVWLTTDFKRDHGYDVRVLITDCNEWGKVP